MPGNTQSRFFLAFDMDGDELISFHEYLLILVFLGVHVEVWRRLMRALVHIVMRHALWLQVLPREYVCLASNNRQPPAGNSAVTDRQHGCLITSCTVQVHLRAAQDITTAFAMFDADESGYIDKDEFETLFETLRASRPGAATSAGRTGFNAGPACAGSCSALVQSTFTLGPELARQVRDWFPNRLKISGRVSALHAHSYSWLSNGVVCLLRMLFCRLGRGLRGTSLYYNLCGIEKVVQPRQACIYLSAAGRLG